MKNIFLSILITLFSVFSVFAQEITILHTNDIHCAVDEGVGLGSVAWLKKAYIEAKKPVLLIDAGDAVQGGTLGSLTKGQAIIRLMNVAGYDFAVPGNHEFDYGMEQFKYLDGISDFHYYSANIFEGKKLLLSSYKIFELGGHKIALIGVTTPASLTSVVPTSFADPKNPSKRLYHFSEGGRGKELYRTLQKVIDEVHRQKVYAVILVAHFGRSLDNWKVRDLVRNLGGVDVVIDGHSHENYIENMPDRYGRQVIVTQTGTRLKTLGRIIIKDDGAIVADKVEHFADKDEIVEEGIAFEKNNYERNMHEPLAEADFTLCVNDLVTGERLVRKSETNLGDLVTDAFRSALDTDVAIINGGGLRSDLPKGVITLQNILTVLPFADKICVSRVTGQQLADILEYAVRLYPKENGGFLQVSGLTFEFDSTKPSCVVQDSTKGFLKIKGKIRRVKNIYVNGEMLDKKKIYTVAGSSFLLKNAGDGFTMFRNIKLEKESHLLDVDAVMEYIYKKLDGKIPVQYANPTGQERIKIVM